VTLLSATTVCGCEGLAIVMRPRFQDACMRPPHLILHSATRAWATHPSCLRWLLPTLKLQQWLRIIAAACAGLLLLHRRPSRAWASIVCVWAAIA
jgi:hypothetical protein